VTETWTPKDVEVSPTNVMVTWESSIKDKWTKKPKKRQIHYRAVVTGGR